MKPHKIEAVTVNHNTSRYMELTLRSLLAHHAHGLNINLTVFDNASTDDTAELVAFAQSRNIPFLQSGFSTATANNSHGEILSRFVLEHPNCTHYLFLDADICFLEDNVLQALLDELEAEPQAFGIGPTMSWDGIMAIPADVRAANPDICDARLHPCCALVKNTPVFQSVVREIGLSCAKQLWANGDEFLDTFKLMTTVMKTHGLKHLVSAKMLLHFFAVSYVWEPAQQWAEAKAQRRDALLTQYRSRKSTPNV